MKKLFKKLSVIAVLLIVLAACSTDARGSSEDEEGEKKEAGDIKIGLSISTLNNPFFVTLRDGAEETAKEAGYEIVTSDAQDDPSTQLSDIEDLIQQGIHVLFVNPVDPDAISSAVSVSNDAHRHVVTVARCKQDRENVIRL